MQGGQRGAVRGAWQGLKVFSLGWGLLGEGRRSFMRASCDFLRERENM